LSVRESDRVLSTQILALSEKVAAGDRLPTERQLAAELGVTRSAIRQAMAVLEAEGRVSREVGRGTFLRTPRGQVTENGEGATDGDQTATAAGGRPGTDYAPADVMMVRRLIEPQAMPLVVAWATARDFTEIDRCLADGGRAAGHTDFERADAALHASMIAASHSPLLIALYAEIEAARHGRVWGDLKRRSASPERLAEYHRDHTDIVTALENRDADRASRAMRAHLARVSRYLLGTDH
jgi:GntR family transcriptional regulator, uxu operon transcriptional repressor